MVDIKSVPADLGRDRLSIRRSIKSALPVVTLSIRPSTFSLPIVDKYDVIHKTKRIAGRESQAMAAGNVHKNWVKFGSAVPDMCSHTQTDRLTGIELS